jgi:hypothetical protein
MPLAALAAPYREHLRPLRAEPEAAGEEADDRVDDAGGEEAGLDEGARRHDQADVPATVISVFTERPSGITHESAELRALGDHRRLCPQGNDVQVIPADLFRATHQLLLIVLRTYEAA